MWCMLLPHQAVEPSCLIPLRFGGQKLILVGDPRQLPATVKSKNAAALGLERSLFERLEEARWVRGGEFFS